MSKHTFHAADVAARLQRLKDANKGSFGWWATALIMDFDNVVKKESVGWFDLSFIGDDGIRSRLKIKVGGANPRTRLYAPEIHSGQIRPLTQAGLAELNATRNPKYQVKKARGDMPARLRVRKYNAKVETANNDGVTLLRDASDNPILPSDDHLSPMYSALALINEAFTAECESRIATGQAIFSAALMEDPKDKKKFVKRTDTAVSAIVAAHPPKGALMMQDQVNQLRKVYATKASTADFDTLTAGVISWPAPALDIGQLTYDKFGADVEPELADQPIANPFASVKFVFKKDDEKSASSAADASRKKKFECTTFYEMLRDADGKLAAPVRATVDGAPISAENVHKFIRPNCKVSATIIVDSICLHAYGISMPAKVDTICVEQAPAFEEKSDLDDLFDGIEELSIGAQARSAASSAAGGAASAAGGAASAAVEDADPYASLMAEMGGDDDA
jgi:hypothetical protein